MPARTWRFHASRWLLLAALILLVGWLVGHPVAVLVAALGAYSAWHIVNGWRLHVWMREPEREIPESYGIWRDIFDNMRSMQKRNREQEQKYISVIRDFQSLTDAFPDATVVIDDDSRIIWFNNAAEALIGLRNPADFGQSITNLFRSRGFSKWFGSKSAAGKPLHMPSPRDENTWLEVSLVSFRQDQTLIILRDITELHNVEQIRRDFVANISHELRTPLTVILGYLELLQGHPEPRVSQAIERMLSQASQIQVLLDDLLELSRLQSDEIHGEDENVDVPGLLMQLKEQGEELSQGRHRLRFDVAGGLRLSGIAADLDSAFSNLLANAIKYTPDDGTIEVIWKDSPHGPQLVVRDTGIGIPRRDIPRITERFYRVGSDRARQTGGSGLGLAIVKHVLNAHEATLTIESELGEGSTFTCTFPPARRRSKDRPEDKKEKRQEG
jgi:two-component system phosphate regulon sensor histidine kinase PhoR